MRNGTASRYLVLYALTLPVAAAVPASDYVNALVCATCHSEIDRTFRNTGMGRSLFRPAPKNTIESYSTNNQFTHVASDTHYAMIQRDGAFYQRRWQIGFGGTETNVEELKIDYVIGSGNHARSYLHRTSTGGFIELPLGWYAEKGGYWGMSPGFDTPRPATRRFVSYECVFCHDAYPKIPTANEAPESDPIFSGELPEGIDCQRCHGPGGKHVRLAQTAGTKLSDIRGSIVNPARLSPALRIDLCSQCHLEPTSSDIPSLIRRFDRGPFSFRPGEPLSDFVLAFDHAPGTGHDDKFEIVNSSAYRLRKSQCFLKSRGTLTCETCHDPHQARRGDDAVQRYSAVCRGCHSNLTNHPAENECISCHMAKRRTDDVVHVAMTDHWIQRTAPKRNLLEGKREQHPGPDQVYRGEIKPYGTAPPLYRAVAQVLMKNNLSSGVADLSRQLATGPTQDAQFYKVLGDAEFASGDPRKAMAAYNQALRIRPAFTKALLALAAAAKASGQDENAVDVLNRTRQIAPNSAPAWFQSGVADFEAGNPSAAIEKMRKALTLDPHLSGGRLGLAEVLWRTGQIDETNKTLIQALSLDPYEASAYDLMGRVLVGKGRAAEGLFAFLKATQLKPAHAPYLYDYALALFSSNRQDDARIQVDAALAADPAMAEAHELSGTLFAAKQQLPEAAKAYAEATRLRPDFARAHLDLARVLVSQGNRTAAVEELRAAASGNDPAVAQVANQALQRMGVR